VEILSIARLNAFIEPAFYFRNIWTEMMLGNFTTKAQVIAVV
jgi:hypothetical protein